MALPLADSSVIWVSVSRSSRPMAETAIPEAPPSILWERAMHNSANGLLIPSKEFNSEIAVRVAASRGPNSVTGIVPQELSLEMDATLR
jgi:hypothetical protein